MVKRAYKRKYFRIKPKNSLKCETTITSCMSKPVKVGTTTAEIVNISPGGMKFSSQLSFPAIPGLVLRFEMKYMGCKACTEGNIVYKRKSVEKSGYYEYGISFTSTNQSIRHFLLKIFRDVMIKDESLIMIRRPNHG
jgi:hypothetical protein